jgi:hypothetical protein
MRALRFGIQDLKPRSSSKAKAPEELSYACVQFPSGSLTDGMQVKKEDTATKNVVNK